MKQMIIYVMTIFTLVLFISAGCNNKTDDTDEESDSNSTSNDFTLTSIAVQDGELLDEYKCEQKVDDVEDSIPLAWSNVPAGTGSLAINMYHYPNEDDTSDVNSYLLLWDIDPSVTSIAHGEADDGDWYMGSNKDVTAVSYTSPCSQSVGSHEYTIKIYALSETPASLPQDSTIDVTYDVFMDALDTVTIIDTASLTFLSVTE